MEENTNTGLYLDLIIHPSETIEEVLEEKNMTQEDLAAKTGFSNNYITRVLIGKKNISSKFARSLEKALNIPAEFFINLQKIYNKEILELKNLSLVQK